jgi:hypothetical protein
MMWASSLHFIPSIPSLVWLGLMILGLLLATLFRQDRHQESQRSARSSEYLTMSEILQAALGRQLISSNFTEPPRSCQGGYFTTRGWPTQTHRRGPRSFHDH